MVNNVKKIYYQGVPGAFSHTTGVKYFGEKNMFVGVNHFDEIFKAVISGDADYGVVPIENTLAGSVYENYDHLYHFDIHVVAEHNLRIEHHLMALPGSSQKTIKKAYSHPKALEQCDRFFENNPHIEEVVAFDTAGAAKLVAQSSDPTHAAIASEKAAQIYDLKIIKRNIEDDPNNYTRFFIVGPKEEHEQLANKSSLIFSTSHKPGSLFAAIKTFADHRLNLTKIESRPLPGNLFEYFFYVDFEFDNKHFEMVKETLEALKKHTHFLKVLGYYKKDVKGRKSAVTKAP